MSAELFRGWELYDRITRANHMRHAETEAAVRARLVRRAGPLRVLDLGCGDGRVAADVLAASRVTEYVGVDLSAGALDLHARRPAPGSAARRLVYGDIAETIRTLPADGFDLVLAGFSLHHFPTDRKSGTLDDVARVLAPGGWFVWTDTYRREGEPREAFLSRLFVEVRTTWTAATVDEREQFVSHIGEFDHPEPLSWMTSQLAARGLTAAEALYRDEFYVCLIGSRGL